MDFKIMCCCSSAHQAYQKFEGETLNCARLFSLVITSFKGIVQQTMEIWLSFIHPHVVPNLYEFLYSAENKRRYFDK